MAFPSDENLKIADQDTSVEVGEELQFQAKLLVIPHFERQGKTFNIFDFPHYSDLDWAITLDDEILPAVGGREKMRGDEDEIRRRNKGTNKKDHRKS